MFVCHFTFIAFHYFVAFRCVALQNALCYVSLTKGVEIKAIEWIFDCSVRQSYLLVLIFQKYKSVSFAVSVHSKIEIQVFF